MENYHNYLETLHQLIQFQVTDWTVQPANLFMTFTSYKLVCERSLCLSRIIIIWNKALVVLQAHHQNEMNFDGSTKFELGEN